MKKKTQPFNFQIRLLITRDPLWNSDINFRNDNFIISV